MPSRPSVPESLLHAAILFGPLAFGCVEPWALSTLQILIFGAAAASAAFPEGPGARRVLVRTLLPAALAVAGLGCLQGLTPRLPADPSRWWPSTASGHGTGRAVLLWMTYAAALWVTPSAASRPGALRRLAWSVFLAGAAVAVIGLYQSAQGNLWVYGFRPVRSGRVPFGPYFNHNHAMGLMAMSFFVGLGLFLSRFAGLWEELALGSRLSDFIAGQLALFSGVAAVACGIYGSASRGGSLALGLAGFCVAFIGARLLPSRGHSRALRALLLAGAVALLGFFLGSAGGVRRIQGFADRSTGERTSLYRTGLRMFRDNPWFGVGLGAFMSAYPPYHERHVVVEAVIDHVHSDWLELLLETGLAGAVLFWSGLAALLWRFLRAWPSLRADHRVLAGGVLAAVLSSLIHSLIDFPFHIPANAVVLFLLLAWLAAAAARGAPGQSHPGSEDPPPSPHPALGLASAALGLWALLPAVAGFHASGAVRLPWTEQPAAYLRAYGWDGRALYLQRAAFAHLKSAGETPSRRLEHLRAGLALSSRALEAEPLHQDIRAVHAALLTALGRSPDAAAFIPGGK